MLGIPDERWGEAVTAIVELNPGEKATEDGMRALQGKDRGIQDTKEYRLPRGLEDERREDNEIGIVGGGRQGVDEAK
ncbi:MAG: acyl-CoA synthetase [Candidatus Methanolliviera sp. GoM_oil]|nr:MAG: acyl-CoA synthetase [Candidatus Methanolliviera sp. GoM_oil]